MFIAGNGELTNWYLPSFECSALVVEEFADLPGYYWVRMMMAGLVQ